MLSISVPATEKKPITDTEARANRVRHSLLTRRSREWLRVTRKNHRPVIAANLARNLHLYFKIDGYDFYFEFAEKFTGEVKDGDVQMQKRESPVDAQARRA